MTRIAYLDCLSGISGDMLLGALVDAGLSPDELRSELAKLPLNGYRLEVAKTQRAWLDIERRRLMADAPAVLLQRQEGRPGKKGAHQRNVRGQARAVLDAQAAAQRGQPAAEGAGDENDDGHGGGAHGGVQSGRSLSASRLMTAAR